MDEDFDWWITCIPDKIEALETHLAKDIWSQLDFSLRSLDILGEYLIVNETAISIQEKRELWDCLASYVGKVYKGNLTNAEWYIELENTKNIYYGIPSLKTPAKTVFAPHFELTAMLDRKRIDFISTVIRNHSRLNHS